MRYHLTQPAAHLDVYWVDGPLSRTLFAAGKLLDPQAAMEKISDIGKSALLVGNSLTVQAQGYSFCLHLTGGQGAPEVREQLIQLSRHALAKYA